MHLIHVQLRTLGLRGLTQKVHKLDGFPHGVVILLLYRERAESTSVLFDRFRGRDSLVGFHHFYAVRLNRISHPHWVKICDDLNGQINLRAKQKYEVLSATIPRNVLCDTENQKSSHRHSR